jgi:hypothetical protein
MEQPTGEQAQQGQATKPKPKLVAKPVRPAGGKKQVTEIVHLPKPPSYRAKPAEFFAYWKSVAKEFPHRTILYVYRTWPVIDREQIGQAHYIEKLTSPINPKEWDHEVLHRWGSGDYKLLLHDSELGKTVAMCKISVRDSEYPPVVSLKEIMMDDPANRSYIEQLRMKGILPVADKEKEEDEDMKAMIPGAVDTLAETVTTLTDKVVDMARESQSKPAPAPPPRVEEQAVAKSLEIVSQAAQMGNRMIESTLAQTGKPVEMFNALTGLVERVMKSSSGDGSQVQSVLINQLMEAQRQSEQRAWEAQNKRIEFAERMAAEAAAKASQQPPAAQPAGADSSAKDPLSMFREFLKVKRELEEDLSPNSVSGRSSVVERLPEIVKSISLGVAGIASIVHNIAVLRSKAGPMAVAPPAQAPELAQELQGVAAGQIAASQTGGDQDVQNEVQYLLGLMARLRRPLLKFIADGRRGDEFAMLVIDMEADIGPLVHERLKALGKEQILALLQADRELWAHLAPIPGRVNQFLDEFLAFDINQEEQSDKETADTPGRR